MSTSIPSEMRVLELQNYDEDIATALQRLRVAKKPTPRPGPGQVLVRIAAAPCNPSDLVFMQGLLEDVPAGILAYQQEMTAGKILIGPGQ